MPEEKAAVPKRAAKKAVAAPDAAKPKKAAKPAGKAAEAEASKSKKAAASTPAKPAAKVATKVAAKVESKAPAVAKPASAARKKAPAAAKLVDKPSAPSAEERQRWIATAAYHRAEKRGFAAGYEVQDWFEAEAEIDALVGKA